MTDFGKFPKLLDDIRILVSNDDGINAPGLKVLERIAKTISKDVWVVAPETEQSGVAHSLTLHEPLRIRKISAKRFAVKGTPTDCVLLAVKAIIPKKRKKISLVLSGINRGANLAEDVTYSGTVAVAMEGTLLQIPSIALSLDMTENKAEQWETVEKHAPDLIRKLLMINWPDDTLLNINFPEVPPSAIKGVKIAPLGRRQINEKLVKRLDPKGRPYYWIGAPIKDDFDRPGVDIVWINDGYITVTPLSIDLTNFKMLEQIREEFEFAS
ncbi:MAG: 5'/3'-nucleotidase SurE [Alphaproteobacteria bacterium]|nr:5'/3'-nucleotidase SurE [Alphaproteobacteria bacterium]